MIVLFGPRSARLHTHTPSRIICHRTKLMSDCITTDYTIKMHAANTYNTSRYPLALPYSSGIRCDGPRAQLTVFRSISFTRFNIAC